MKKTLLIPILFCATTLFAQEQNTELQKQRQEIFVLKQKLNNQQSVINQQKTELENLSSKTENQEKKIDSLTLRTDENVKNIHSIAENLGAKIQQTENASKDSISKLDKDVSTNLLYWIIATLVTLILGGVIYWLLGKRIANSKTDVETQIKNTKTALEEESIKLDSKLMEVLESQLKLKQEEKAPTKEADEKDHSLVLKVADEVTRILMNLEVMDKEIRGYKHLKKYSESILDNLKAYGYEIPVLIGQPYSQGLNMVATLEFDENIEQGKQVIKRIIKPQVNYNHKMIQAAKVIVAFNE
ncbi:MULTISPECIES: hypothetical protein [Flavobacteriales]|uniref:Septum formation initiator n=1 Tax=Chryseobacterium piscium TaxID=333702 RepID=A0A3D9BLE2_9FLAO|nr:MULTISPECIES: hypothetical protein [Flavobacteriales]REC54171.1 hypothetical protein DRF62_10685 [Chryseobacterium piscium]